MKDLIIDQMNAEREQTHVCSKCGCKTDLEESDGEIYHRKDCRDLLEAGDDPQSDN